MNTISNVVTRARLARAGVATAVGTVLAVTFGVGMASAAVDPTGGAGTAIFGTLSSYLTGQLIPAFFGLVVIGLIVGMAVAWVRKGRKA